ncbi:MAG TPA: ABC transporter substrate-binding protein [Myxococcales bacterium]|nr:ABC transporter substrate-binding protein [Myxococcales bacterium]
MRRTRGSLLLCAVLAFAGCKQKEQGSGMVGANANGPIVVGEVGSMTGTEATFGTSSDRGIQLAFSETNSSGGVKGRQIQVIALDDEGKPEEAATAATRLIASEHVTALLGEVASTRSLFMAPKAQAARVPMVTPSSTNEKVTQVGDYVFRACFIDPFQGYVMAKFARDNLKVTKAAILKDVRNDYSVGLAKVFTENFTKMGGKIVDEESFSNGDVDFKAQLTNIKNANPEALYVPAYYTEVGLISRQAREVGFTGPLLGGDGWDSEKLYEIGGDALLGCYFSNHYSVDDPSPRIQEFVAKFKKAYGGQVPDSLAAQAYDAAGMLVDAMKRAKDLSGPSIRDALAETRGYKGVTGDITMDQNRNASKPAVVLKIGKGGKYEFAGKIYPEGMSPPPGESAVPGPKKTEGNTAPNAAPGNVPTPTPTPTMPGTASPAESAAVTGQPQGLPAGEHPKK